MAGDYHISTALVALSVIGALRYSVTIFNIAQNGIIS